MTPQVCSIELLTTMYLTKNGSQCCGIECKFCNNFISNVSHLLDSILTPLVKLVQNSVGVGKSKHLANCDVIHLILSYILDG